MKKFYYVIRQKDQNLWLAHKGHDKWTADSRNIHVFNSVSEQAAYEYVTKQVQLHHKEPLVMEAWT